MSLKEISRIRQTHLLRCHRAAALPTILALITLVLVTGLAMGTLSTLSLRFNQKYLDSTRSELMARSGLAYFLARVRQFESQDDQRLNPLDPKPLAMADMFPHGIHVSDGDYSVDIQFDSEQPRRSSTDNLAGEEPKLGSLDTDGVPRIPAFGLDLVIQVRGPSSEHTYRAVLKRFWPFAVYSKHGSLTLMGQPELKLPNSNNQPTQVEGDVYTEWRVHDDSGQPIVFEGRVKGYGLGQMTDPSKLLANLEARAGYQPQRVPYHPLILGMRGHLNQPATRLGEEERRDGSGRLVEMFYYYDNSSWVYNEWPRKWGETEFARVDKDLVFPPPVGHSPSVIYNEVGNFLDGDLYYSHEADAEVTEVAIAPSRLGSFPDPALNWPVRENILLGKIHKRRPPARDPLDSIESQTQINDSGFYQLNVPHQSEQELFDYATGLVGGAPMDFEVNDDGPSAAFLSQTLTLTEDRASVNGIEVPRRPQYTINGSLSNRQSIFHRDSETLFVRESQAGLNLQGVTLRVKGDLDLGASGFEGRDLDGDGDSTDDSIQISGAGATLIVDGQLILGNANINAGDQAFVIFAKDIVIKAGGTFNGLLIASRSVSILSQDKNTLTIEGGIACADKELGGGITIRGAHIKHEPRYLKGINGAGDFYLASWRKV